LYFKFLALSFTSDCLSSIPCAQFHYQCFHCAQFHCVASTWTILLLPLPHVQFCCCCAQFCGCRFHMRNSAVAASTVCSSVVTTFHCVQFHCHHLYVHNSIVTVSTLHDSTAATSTVHNSVVATSTVHDSIASALTVHTFVASAVTVRNSIIAAYILCNSKDFPDANNMHSRCSRQTMPLQLTTRHNGNAATVALIDCLLHALPTTY